MPPRNDLSSLLALAPVEMRAAIQNVKWCSEFLIASKS
jgi:hypothetical protein